MIYNHFIKSSFGSKLQEFCLENADNFKEAIENIDIQLIGYQKADNVSQIDIFAENSKILLKNCKIFSVNKVAYIGCKKCVKKIYEGKCPTCGPCRK